ncbi:bile pigment transporter 1 [[Candida] railenensis]|uniref:Bile pigment transporter 1 n=1 Tax=[Candida] railenensis TaxID=45579 RepID=A0A9P0QUA1_9ASCO|nr:bile pigment transporter 1 [[Candida] railenensis]
MQQIYQYDLDIEKSIFGTAVSSNRTICNQSILEPLCSPSENYPNPSFVALVIAITNIIFTIFILFQLSQLLWNNWYGPFRIKYGFGSILSKQNLGLANACKVFTLTVQVVLASFLLGLNYESYHDINSISLVTLVVAILFAAVPLHLSEPARILTPSASLLLFWCVQIIVSGAWTLQELLTPYKIFNSTVSSTVSIFMFANSINILLLEIIYYKPTKELLDYFELNELDISFSRNIFSELFISWLDPTIKEVYNADELDESKISLPSLPMELRSDFVQREFQEYWDIEKKKSNPSLFATIVRANLGTLIVMYIFSLGEVLISFTQPFLLQKLIVFFSVKTSPSTGSNTPLITGIAIVILIFLVSVLRSILINRTDIQLFKMIFKVQGSISSIAYEKALKLSPEVRKSKTSGDIINHFSTDISTIEDVATRFSEVINNILRIGISLFSLFKVIGNGTWAGLTVALILVPISSKISTSVFPLYSATVKYKDARIRLTSEILSSIRSVKLYSWEKPILKRLDTVRNDQELYTNKRIGVFNAFSTFLFSCIPFFISFSSFLLCVYISDVPLTPERVFPALALFDMLASPILMLPYMFSSMLEIKVSMDRLRQFLISEELEKKGLQRTYKPLKSNEISVTIENSSFIWSTKEQPVETSKSNIALSDINFTARKSQLTCIVGKVGSGKTTLIKSILGEIPRVEDKTSKLHVNGTIAYCSQAPWILNATVKENILFGNRFEKEFYDIVIGACELISDLDSLPDGDETVVGEKGISLSGGQKARVSLARAVYARADVYLLDDILSAVDAHVGKNIIHKVLSANGVLATKTKILATNSVGVLSEAHEILLLEDGGIVERGTFRSIMDKNKSKLYDLIKEYGRQDEVELALTISQSQDLASEAVSLDSLDEVKDYQPDSTNTGRSRRGTIGAATILPFGQENEIVLDSVEQVGEDGLPIQKKTEHVKEEVGKGRVKLSVFLEYIRACNYPYALLYLLLTTTSIGSMVYGKYLLKTWSEINERNGANTDPLKYLGYYATSGVVAGGLTFISAIIAWTYCVICGSKYFHDKMVQRVLRSPMSFFDTTPIGRILNRFSQDIGLIDALLAWIIIDLLGELLNAIAVFFVIVVSLPPMGVMILLLVLVYKEIKNFFVPASREFKRLISVKSSPIFSHLQESVNGVESLRAYNQQDRFIFKNKAYLDSKIKVNYLLNMCNRWLSIRLRGISSIVLLTSAMYIVLTINTKFQISVGLVGFIMVYVLRINDILNSIIRLWVALESKSVALERLVEYCNLPSEAEMVIESSRPPKDNWPSNAAISFDNYSTRYRENLDPVLTNICLDFKPSEKIGIVGRTGAGKSSLTLAIFRMIESTTGNINIDGIDTSKIGLYDLRSKLSIIPQDSQTIEGTIRQNLDPFGKYEDSELWRVLELAHLRDHVKSMHTNANEESKTDEVATGLDAFVTEGGSNLSSGQKQLLCLARALLNPSKILILDEATAAVDVQTDKIIQDTIRKEFNDKTILTIAHRLETIMDSDRVVVLDKGKVKEFATVPELLDNKDGEFYSLCEKGGFLKNKQESEEQ